MPIPFRVVLVEPEIPQNTGNIARVCAATTSELHLVGKLGFRIDEHAVRRAGLDYWHLVTVRQHVSFAHFDHEHQGGMHFFSATGAKSYLEAPFAAGDAFVFGRESTGLPEELLEKNRECVYAIPTLGAVRSLNLGNAVSIVVYEALRQIGALAHTAPG